MHDIYVHSLSNIYLENKIAVNHLDQDGWNPDRNSILVVTKARDNKLVIFTQQLAEWLIFTPRFGKKNPFIV